ncbi:MAG: NAD(P)/FAD-dependent oxidoreductase [Christensenellales bacterium]
MGNVCVIGGGPAGMAAAYAAAENGHTVTLLEKNEKLGKKLFLTGKGRCNITNAAPIEDFFDSVVKGGAFLHSAFYTFDNMRLLQTLERFGFAAKTERGGRVFPVSDKSSDVIKALSNALAGVGVRVKLNAKADSLIIEKGCVAGVKCGGNKLPFNSVIVATGGVSYPSTGSDGDGYLFAKAAGHNVTELSASLIALDTKEDTARLSGLTLKNIGFTLFKDGFKAYKALGELLFTHTGISGPLVLTASAYMDGGADYSVSVDLKPALDEKTLDARILRDIAEKTNQRFASLLKGLIPGSLVPLIAARSAIPADLPAHSITRDRRRALCKALKQLEFSIRAKRPIEEAVITRGGVSLTQIDPSTMQSKICKGLYFAGEVIDADALTGGYNLQIAFSTGYLAGASC